MEQDIPCKWRSGKAGVATHLSNKKYFKSKIKRDYKGHQITTKGSIQQEKMTLKNIYVPDIGTPKLKQILINLKEEIDSNTMTVEKFSMPLSEI